MVTYKLLVQSMYKLSDWKPVKLPTKTRKGTFDEAGLSVHLHDAKSN
jgi:hypothetical protein